MARIGSLSITLGINMAEFTKDLTKASKQVRRTGRKMRKSFKNVDKQILKTTKIVAGLAGPAALGLLVKSSFSTVDALAKTADKLGLTTEALAGMRHAAEQTGIAQNTLDMALQRMTRRIAEAGQGTGEAKAALKELGLDAKKLAAGAPDEAFQKIAGAMENVTNKGDKLRLAFKLFDSEGAALVNTLALGTKGLKAMQKEAEALGLAVSRVDAKKIEAANDAFNRVKGIVKGVGNTIAVKLAPFLKDVADRLKKAAIESDGFKKEISSAFDFIVGAIGRLGDALQFVHIGFKTLQTGFSAGADIILTMVLAIADGWRQLANLIPGIDFAPFTGLEETLASVRDQTMTLTDELVRLVNEPMPSEAMEQWKTEVLAKAAEVEEGVKKATTGGESAEKLTATKQAELTKQLEALRVSVLTEEEILGEKHIRDLERLSEAEQAKLDTLMPFHMLREKLEVDHQKKLGKIKEDQAKKDRQLQITTTASTMQTIGQILSAAANLSESRNKKEFERNKKLRMASVVVNTASAIMRAYADNDFWTATGISIVLGLLGAAQLSKISGSSFQGGGGSVGASGASAPASGGGGGGGGGDNNKSQASAAPLNTQTTTEPTVAAGQDVRVTVMLEGQPIIDTVQRASQDGRIEIDANSVRAA